MPQMALVEKGGQQEAKEGPAVHGTRVTGRRLIQMHSEQACSRWCFPFELDAVRRQCVQRGDEVPRGASAGCLLSAPHTPAQSPTAEEHWGRQGSWPRVTSVK